MLCGGESIYTMMSLTKYRSNEFVTPQPVYLAADVEAVLGECEEVVEVLVNLIPDIGKLSKVQALLDRLKGTP